MNNGMLLLFSSKLCFILCEAGSGEVVSLAQSLLTGIVIALRTMLAATRVFGGTRVTYRAIFTGRV